MSDLFRLFEKRCSFAEDAFGPDSQLQEALELRLREAEERRRGGQAVAQVQRHHDGRPLRHPGHLPAGRQALRVLVHERVLGQPLQLRQDLLLHHQLLRARRQRLAAAAARAARDAPHPLLPVGALHLPAPGIPLLRALAALAGAQHALRLRRRELCARDYGWR